jgi:hypothetical protein
MQSVARDVSVRELSTASTRSSWGIRVMFQGCIPRIGQVSSTEWLKVVCVALQELSVTCNLESNSHVIVDVEIISRTKKGWGSKFRGMWQTRSK